MNNQELIDDILKWYNHNQYIRLGSDVSVTELLMPMQLVHLRNRYGAQVKETNLGNVLPSLIGTATHDILQRFLKTEAQISGKYLIERRLLSVVNGVRVAGRFDMLANGENLHDIKVTRVWKYLFGGRDEWTEQLNLYRYMLHLDGYNIKTLNIMMVLLDWQQSKTYHDPKYPKDRIQMIKIPVWSLSKSKKFLEDRVDGFLKSQNLNDCDLPKCSAAERWAAETKYKLYRTKDQKIATKVFDSDSRAVAYQRACKKADDKKWAGSHIKTFTGTPWKRCETWCSVADKCHQYKQRIQ
jgi:hypothetical protein